MAPIDGAASLPVWHETAIASNAMVVVDRQAGLRADRTTDQLIGGFGSIRTRQRQPRAARDNARRQALKQHLAIQIGMYVGDDGAAVASGSYVCNKTRASLRRSPRTACCLQAKHREDIFNEC
jgi:hypothetical protein